VAGVLGSLFSWRMRPLQRKTRLVSETLPLQACEVRSRVGEVESLGLRTASQRCDEALDHLRFIVTRGDSVF
jgi:hypothetical protein